MEYRIVEKEAFGVKGVNFYGDPFHNKGGWDHENEIGHTWSRYLEMAKVNSEVFFEIHCYNDNTLVNGHFEVLVGEVYDGKYDTRMVTKFFPKMKYYMVTLQGSEIESDWVYMIML